VIIIPLVSAYNSFYDSDLGSDHIISRLSTTQKFASNVIKYDVQSSDNVPQW